MHIQKPSMKAYCSKILEMAGDAKTDPRVQKYLKQEVLKVIADLKL